MLFLLCITILADTSREGITEQEEPSRKETEASSIAPSAQEGRQQSDNEQGAIKVNKTKKKSGSKRSGRALSPVSQRQDPHFVFAGTTQRHHLTHQTHWKVEIVHCIRCSAIFSRPTNTIIDHSIVLSVIFDTGVVHPKDVC